MLSTRAEKTIWRTQHGRRGNVGVVIAPQSGEPELNSQFSRASRSSLVVRSWWYLINYPCKSTFAFRAYTAHWSSSFDRIMSIVFDSGRCKCEMKARPA